MMSLWFNLRKSLRSTGKARNLSKIKSESFSSGSGNNNLEGSEDLIKKTDENISEKEHPEQEEMLKFPYGSKECVVYKKRGNLKEIK